MIELGFSDIASIGTLAVAGTMTLLEVSKIPINPWSAIGRVINREILEQQKACNKKVDALNARLDESEIKAARMRIQRFADEMYENVRHSKEHFDLILADITAYNNYCDTHPGFVNEKTRVAQGIIREKYAECMKERSFRDLDDEEAV